MKNLINKYYSTFKIEILGITNGGIFYLLPNCFLNIVYLLPLMFLWTILINSGVQVDMSLNQMLTYTFINCVLSPFLVISTFASSWNATGKFLSLFIQPMSVIGQIISKTIGNFIPMLIMFSLPMICIAPFFNIDVIPKTPWFFISFILCVSLGFAIDIIFVCISIRLRNMVYLSILIRGAIVSLFSGTIIPFKLLPFSLSEIFIYQPFASLGGAPLSLFVGINSPKEIIPIQIFWNIILWIVALIWFKNSRERMVSFNG